MTMVNQAADMVKIPVIKCTIGPASISVKPPSPLLKNKMPDKMPPTNKPAMAPGAPFHQMPRIQHRGESQKPPPRKPKSRWSTGNPGGFSAETDGRQTTQRGEDVAHLDS